MLICTLAVSGLGGCAGSLTDDSEDWAEADDDSLRRADRWRSQVKDAGSPVDAGGSVTLRDAGSSTTIDAGSARTDSGTSSSTDTGAGTTPTGTPSTPADSGTNSSTDSGTSSSTDSGTSTTPTDQARVWSPLTVMTVVNPMNHGATGNGSSDDLGALQASVNALPTTGGIVYFPRGRTFKKTNLLTITKSHVKLWSPNRQAEIFQSVAGQRRRQSILCRSNAGCGMFGLKLRSDARERFDALEDNQISADRSTLVEVAGCEIQGSAATGMFFMGSSEHYIEGNYVHHTWADHIHHTDGANASWVWNNFIFNEGPSSGDDGIACVTYGPASPRCRDMEWWRNTILHSGWGRGYSVIGGDHISIHDNWAIGVAGAGIIIASESSYDSASCEAISIANNIVSSCGHTIGHPGILISGDNPAAPPLKDITLTNNTSVGTPAGAYRAEGAYTGVSNQGMKTSLSTALPTQASVRYADTAILRTRDTSHVAQASRNGLHRIHVRESPDGSGSFQQRFEYVVKGAEAAVTAFVKARVSAGDYLSEQRTIGGAAYALVLSAQPVAVPAELQGVPFRELRTRDTAADLGWLWTRIDSATY
jgi:hypothetical protein